MKSPIKDEDDSSKSEDEIMDQPNQPKSSKQMWFWALLALFMLMSVGIAVVAIKLIAKSGTSAKVLGLGSSAIQPVDLTAHYDKSSSWNGASAWEVVPHGPATLGGVPFTVDGLLRLSGSGDSAKSYREKVEGIRVGKKFGRLHLLHLTGATGPADLPYARIVLHYADDSTTSLPLAYGTHARYWHRSKYEFPSALSDPNSKVVWRGTHESTDKTLRIFKTSFENPKPDLDVMTIDLVSENVAANAVILAMSIGPSNLPKPKDDPASLPEPEEPFEGEIKFTAVDSKDGKPVANVKLKINGTETAGSFRTPDAVTDAKGECLVKHPGDSTRTMTVVASGDGIAMKTIRWGQRAGEGIPSEYMFRAEKAVAIGGVVQDEAGQPVRNVKISISPLGTPGNQTSSDQLPFNQVSLTNDDKGRWEFRSLPQSFSSFSIAVTHPDYLEARYLSDGTDRAWVGERVKLATLLKNEGVFNLRKGLVVTGKVLNDKREPIVGAKLLLGDSRFSGRPNQARTDERGEFRLPGATAGSTHLTVQANGYSPESRQLTVDAKTKPAEFKLGPGQTFKAKVVDEFGSPVRDARITVDMWENRQTLDLSGKTDSRGRATITSAPATGMSGTIYKAGYMNMGGIQFVADGEEHTFTLRKGLTITGTVVDVDTKESIDRFDVTRGQNSGDQIYWQNYNVTKGVNGAFSIKLDQQGIIALQIESDDHLPGVILLGTNGETHFNVELKKGTGPKGIVHAPDGQPAAGAQLGVLVKGKMLNIGAGRITVYGGNETKVATANEDGSFTLRFYANAEKIVATHSKGYAETSFSNFVSGSTLKLQPWGKIEGTLKIGTRPGTNELVLLSGDGNLQFNFEEFKVTTDDQGRFFMASVPPGDRRLIRLIPIGDRSWGHSHMHNVTVKAGEVTTTTMGGNGRTLIGKLVMSDPSRTIDWRTSGHHVLSWYPKPPPYRNIEEYRAWESLPETIAARKSQRSYTLQMQDDGTFRVDDVLAGKYDFNIRVTEPRDTQGRQNAIGTLTTNVTVPEIPDAPAAPPLDLGTIEVPLTRAPQRNAALR